MSDQQKVVGDWTLATEDTILALRSWLSQLQAWKAQGHADETDFAAACQQLQEAGLWGWASQARGHGITSLAEALVPLNGDRIEAKEIIQRNGWAAG